MTSSMTTHNIAVDFKHFPLLFFFFFLTSFQPLSAHCLALGTDGRRIISVILGKD